MRTALTEHRRSTRPGSDPLPVNTDDLESWITTLHSGSVHRHPTITKGRGRADRGAENDGCGFGLSIIENLDEPGPEAIAVTKAKRSHNSTRSSPPPNTSSWNESNDTLLHNSNGPTEVTERRSDPDTPATDASEELIRNSTPEDDWEAMRAGKEMAVSIKGAISMHSQAGRSIKFSPTVRGADRERYGIPSPVRIDEGPPIHPSVARESTLNDEPPRATLGPPSTASPLKTQGSMPHSPTGRCPTPIAQSCPGQRSGSRRANVQRSGKSVSPNNQNLSFLDAQFPAPQRDRLPPPAPSRKKHVSACANCSHVPRLESRIEALERENELLEAALMAAIKTSGTLNRCPCIILSRFQEARRDGVGMLTDPTNSRERAGPRQVMGRSGHNPTGDDRKDCNEGDEVNGASVNALEVFFETCVENEEPVSI
jgi:hypothetical protein